MFRKKFGREHDFGSESEHVINEYDTPVATERSEWVKMDLIEKLKNRRMCKQIIKQIKNIH